MGEVKKKVERRENKKKKEKNNNKKVALIRQKKYERWRVKGSDRPLTGWIEYGG